MLLQSQISSFLATPTSDLGHMQPWVPLESYQTSEIYPPILQVKLRGDVIFHLGSVIILVVSGALLWLGGRSEPSRSLCAFQSQSVAFFSWCLCCCSAFSLTAMNETAGCLFSVQGFRLISGAF